MAQAYNDMGASKHVVDTDLRRQGVTEIRDLDGQGLLDLLAAMELRGVSLDDFRAKRRNVTPGQLRQLGMLRRFTEISDLHYYQVLQRYGGVNTGADLDARGYRLVTLELEDLAGGRPGLDVTDPTLAARPGFASRRQLALVKALWTEWAGNADEAALNAWLERSHRVSALRFLTAGKASQTITALKNMKRRRKAAAEKVPA